MGPIQKFWFKSEGRNMNTNFEIATLLLFTMAVLSKGEPWGQPMIPQPISPTGPIKPTAPIRPTGPIEPLRPTGVVPEVIEARNAERGIGGIRGTAVTRVSEVTRGTGVTKGIGVTKDT